MYVIVESQSLTQSYLILHVNETIVMYVNEQTVMKYVYEISIRVTHVIEILLVIYANKIQIYVDLGLEVLGLMNYKHDVKMIYEKSMLGTISQICNFRLQIYGHESALVNNVTEKLEM